MGMDILYIVLCTYVTHLRFLKSSFIHLSLLKVVRCFVYTFSHKKIISLSMNTDLVSL